MSASDVSDNERRGKPRVLIVDDNPDIHHDFQRVLTDSIQDKDLANDELLVFGSRKTRDFPKPSYELDHAFSGLEAVTKVRKSAEKDQPYQLAFVDIRMPGIDGVETIERIWKVDANVQVVACTAYTDYSWSELAQRLGLTDKLLVLKKPFDQIEVAQLTSTLVEKWYVTKRAALRLEQMELLIARYVQRLLNLQRLQPHQTSANAELPAPQISAVEVLFNSESPQILVMVESASLCREIRDGLGPPFRIIEPNDDADSLQQAEELVPDLVVIGVPYREVDVPALSRRLKSNEMTCHIPLIVLSSPGSDDWHLKAIEAGADDFIVTPLRPALLRARVLNLLASSRRLPDKTRHDTTLEPREVAGTQIDAQFLRRAADVVEMHLSDCDFDVEEFAPRVGVSRRQLFRKFKAISGQTPNGFIRVMRLKRAARLLRESQMTVTEITYAVGFSSLKHFRNLFRDHFGMSPIEYAKRQSAD